MVSLNNKIWLINPAAIPPKYEVRIQTLKRAQYLRAKGYDVTIVGGSYLHNTHINLITDNKPYLICEYDGIKYIHIKNTSYGSSNRKRIFSMVELYLRMWYYANSFDRPNYICAHSAIPFGVISYFVARKLRSRFIVDVVDLWPESFVAYGLVSSSNLFVRFAYRAEYWLYKKAEVLIFSMEGGKDYLKEKKWTTDEGGKIDLKKVFYINNGVDLTDFEFNQKNYTIKDDDLVNDKLFKVTYLGSIRLVNNLKRLLDAAKYLTHISAIKFLIYGDGEERENLEQYCKDNNISNVIFKQKWVELKYVPFILSKSSLNILNYMPSPLFRFGASQSKSFQYMASGKPICANVEMKYCPITKYQIGIAKSFPSAKEYADAIVSFYNLSASAYLQLCNNAKTASEEYDYARLTDKFIYLLENELK
jgi:glycosyltransferase involved in cell wall biosynthesis